MPREQIVFGSYNVDRVLCQDCIMASQPAMCCVTSSVLCVHIAPSCKHLLTVNIVLFPDARVPLVQQVKISLWIFNIRHV
jgi:hypothetical protein